MIGQTISHYRVTGQLGAGGMGVVYEAEDIDLGRKVALKFLPPQLSADQNALDRFLLEARTASALNHPNICTIYAVEKVRAEDGQTQFFIAMELLEGETLDQRLRSGVVPLDRMLDWGIQLADALGAAHAKGVIHRDIKPANIFITQRGQVKVLDFGLAKLASPEMEMETIGAATLDSPAQQLTSPGATVGTIAYMSPEQARGEVLDARTDLFSLGVVIYQMATGRLPFSGATSAVTFHAILELDPPPPLQLNPALPPKLDEAIAKALEKDRDLRYQSAVDLRGDLKRLKRDTESGRKSTQSSPAIATAPSQSAAIPAASGVAPPASKSGSSAVIATASQHKVSSSVVAALVIVVLAAAAYGIYAFVTRSRPVPFQNVSVTKMTDTGDAVIAALSPNGEYILAMTRKNGLASLWLRNVPTNSNAQVQPAEDVYYNGLRFSPDGNYFYFVRSDPGTPELKFLYRAPLLGGTPQKLAQDVDSNVTFSPDGKQVAFMRFDNPEPGKYRLIVRPVQGGDDQERVLASGSKNEPLFNPEWSPDGKVILCDQINVAGAIESLVEISVSDGKRSVSYRSNGEFFENPTWMPDGMGLLGLVRDQSSNFNQSRIAYLSLRDGKLTPITHDTNNYLYLSVAASGKALGSVLSESRWNVFVMPASGPVSQGRNVTSAEATTNLTWTKDGNVVADQNAVLNRIDVASGTRTPIATMEGKPGGNPNACPDGRYIVFDLGLPGGDSQNQVWRVDAAGGNLKQLTHGKIENHGVCTADGWVYYIEQKEGHALERVPIEGGPSQIVSNLPMSEVQFDISPDGKWAAFGTIDHESGHKVRLVLVETSSGKAKLMDFNSFPFGLLRFSPDGKAVIYPARENGVDNLWQQPLDGSKGRRITDFTSEHIYDFHWSFDGKQLAIVRGHTDSDVVLIRDAGK